MSTDIKIASGRQTVPFQPAARFPSWDLLGDAESSLTILIVDEKEMKRRLLKGVLKATPYRVLESRTPSEALEILKAEKIDLVIVDLVMPEISGIEFCQVLKASRETQLIPILIVTSVQGIENEVAGLESGADDFLILPLQPAVVRTRIATMLRHKALIDSFEEAETILFALARSVESRDCYTGLHCERLAAYSVALGQAMGLARQDQLALFRGGYLHDIGKVGIPDSILFKQGELSPEEWVTMREHTTRGEAICRPMKTLAPVLPIIRSHHEKWDGTGYPDGLAGEDIPLLARTLQVADIYDALTTERPYKPAFTHEQAVATMFEEAQRGWRDPELVALFADITRNQQGTQPTEFMGSSVQESLENMRRELAR